jgi:hypothetical protein
VRGTLKEIPAWEREMHTWMYCNDIIPWVSLSLSHSACNTKVSSDSPSGRLPLIQSNRTINEHRRFE